MSNTTDVHSLGTDYTVLDKKGNPIGNIQIITHDEILDAAIGPYDCELFESIDEYLNRSISELSGFEDVDPAKVMWFTSIQEDVVLADLVEKALRQGCNIVILEYLDMLIQ